MRLSKCKRIAQVLGLLALLSMATIVSAESPTASVNDLSVVELDLQSRATPLRYPYSETQLKLLDALPSRLFINASSEISYRLETNPFQAPAIFNDPFIQTTDALRWQNNVTMGYALTPKDRVAVSFFALTNWYDDKTPFSLDSSSYSIAPSYQRTWFHKNNWSLSSNLQARQTLRPNGQTNGSILPALTLVRGLNRAGYAYFNAALDLGRQHFAIGDLDTLTPFMTLGYGWELPYGAKSPFWHALGGLGVSLSSTYAHTTSYHPVLPAPDHFQSIFLSAEVYKPLYRKAPLTLFVRSEHSFNFGHDNNAFGVSGINYRLFGGIRATLNKPAIFVRPLKADKR